MREIIRIGLENEMDLILAHKRSMKLAELCGLSVLIQTSFATAVSEISRYIIDDNPEKASGISLGINPLKGGRKELMALISANHDFDRKHHDAVKYAKRLVKQLDIRTHKDGQDIILTQAVQFSGLINDTRLDAFISYFKKELPLSPYDELRKKNIQLIEMAEKLAESERQYRDLTETLPLMMFTTNAGGNLTYGNNWLKDYFNLAEIPPGKLAWASLVNIKDNKYIRDEWEKSMMGQAPFRAQARLKSKNDDDALWHLISLMPVKNEQNQVVSWTGFFVDIHAQKLIEETLKNNDELKAAQKQLLNSQVKLEEKVKELNRSNHDLEQFAYIASHDLQEPLRKIRSFSDLLEKNIDDRDKSLGYLQKIDQASSRMQTLIKDVLNYSRLSRSEGIFGQADLNEILTNVKLDMELLIDDKKAVVKASSLPVISGIPQQLYQLFYNIISNSLKFSRDTPEIIVTHRKLEAADIEASPDLNARTQYVRISIRDNGIGFEQKHARQIFTIFKRLNSKDVYAGTGIGLALCKKIVDNHHGLIEAFSEPGKGTEFVVILPVE
jgi:PAS domain S-box-containing protein